MIQAMVTFRSAKFPPYDGEEEQINPGLWGKRLAEYLVEKLAGLGVETEEPVPEDWGWFIPVRSERFRLAIWCGHQNGEDDEFLCFTEPSTPIVRRLFQKMDLTEKLGRVVEALERVLAAAPDIKDVAWSTGGG